MSAGQNSRLAVIAGASLALALGGCSSSPPGLGLQSGTVANLTVTPAQAFDYGQVLVDGVSDQTFTVMNVGSVAATQLTGAFYLSQNFGYPGGAFPGSGGSCGTTLVGGASCTVVVRFSPRSFGAANDSLHLSYFDGVASASLSSPTLAGWGQWGNGGSLDDTFGGSGQVVIPLSGMTAAARAVTLQTDGSIVLAGSGSAGAVTRGLLARVTAQGALDPTFGTSGTASFSLGDGGDTEARALAIDRAGRVLVAGTTVVAGRREWLVARFTPSGTPDMTFATGGALAFAMGSGDADARALVLSSDGAVLVAGVATNGGVPQAAVARLTTAGALDATFGSGGSTFVPLGSGACEANAIQVLSGWILLAGDGKGAVDLDFALARLDRNGNLDPTFAAGGVALVDSGSADDRAAALSVGADGSFALAGSSTEGSVSQLSVVRLMADGTPLTAFGGGVVRLGGATGATGVALDTSARVTFAGNGAAGGVLGRLSPGGTLDTGLGGGLFSLGLTTVQGLAIQANTKPVAVGATGGALGAVRVWP